jgi:hypothetical protein
MCHARQGRKATYSVLPPCVRQYPVERATTTSAPARPFRRALGPGRPFSGAPSDATCAVMSNRHELRTCLIRQRPRQGCSAAQFLCSDLWPSAQVEPYAIGKACSAGRLERLERKCEILVERGDRYRHSGLGLGRLAQIPSLHLKNIDLYQIFSRIWHRMRDKKLQSSGVARLGKAMLNMPFCTEASRPSSLASMNPMLSALSPPSSASCW